MFFNNLMRRRNMLRNWWSCRTNEGAESSFRIPRNQIIITGRIRWMQWSVRHTWKKKCDSVTIGIAQTAHWQKWPSFVWLHWDSLPEWAGKIHQRIGRPCNQLTQGGGSWTWQDRVSLWQAHRGRKRWELSLGLLPIVMVTSLVTKVVHEPSGHLYLFYKLYKISYLCSFTSTIPSNKVIWYPRIISIVHLFRQCCKE